MKVARVEGDAKVLRGGKWIPVKQGMDINPGERIRTKAGQVILRDGRGAAIKVRAYSDYDISRGTAPKGKQAKPAPELSAKGIRPIGQGPRPIEGGIEEAITNINRLPEPRGILDAVLEDTAPLFELFDIVPLAAESLLRQTFQPGFDRLEFLDQRLDYDESGNLTIKGPLEASFEVKGPLKIPAIAAAGVLEFYSPGGSAEKKLFEANNILRLLPSWNNALKRAGKLDEARRIVRFAKNPAEALNGLRAISDDAGESIIGKLTIKNLTQSERDRIAVHARRLGKGYDEDALSRVFINDPVNFLSSENALAAKRGGKGVKSAQARAFIDRSEIAAAGRQEAELAEAAKKELQVAKSAKKEAAAAEEAALTEKVTSYRRQRKIAGMYTEGVTDRVRRKISTIAKSMGDEYTEDALIEIYETRPEKFIEIEEYAKANKLGDARRVYNSIDIEAVAKRQEQEYRNINDAMIEGEALQQEARELQEMRSQILKEAGAKRIRGKNRTALGLNNLKDKTMDELERIKLLVDDYDPSLPEVFVDEGKGTAASRARHKITDYAGRIRDTFTGYGIKGLVYYPVKAAIRLADRNAAIAHKKIRDIYETVKHIPGNEKRIFDYMEGVEVKDISEAEIAAAKALREMFDQYSKDLKLPTEKIRALYVPHIVKKGTLEGAPRDAEIDSAIRFMMPEAVFNPFMLKRTKDMEHVENVWVAAATYSKAAEKSKAMDPVLSGIKENYFSEMSPEAKRFTIDYFDNLLGKRYGQRFLEQTPLGRGYLKAADITTAAVYRGTLAALDSTLLNLSQTLQTLGEFGPKATLYGKWKMGSRAGRKEAIEFGLAQNKMSQEALGKDISGMISANKGWAESFDKVGFWAWDRVEFWNRGVAYHAAKKVFEDGARNIGIPTNTSVFKEMSDNFADYGVWKTQYGYGPEDVAPLLQNRGLRPFTQFLNYTYNFALNRAKDAQDGFKNLWRAGKGEAPTDELFLALRELSNKSKGLPDYTPPRTDWDLFRRYQKGEVKTAIREGKSPSVIDRANAAWYAVKKPVLYGSMLAAADAIEDETDLNVKRVLNPFDFSPMALDPYSGTLMLRTSPTVAAISDIIAVGVAQTTDDRALKTTTMRKLGRDVPLFIPGGRFAKKLSDNLITQFMNHGISYQINAMPEKPASLKTFSVTGGNIPAAIMAGDVPEYFVDLFTGPDIQDVPRSYTTLGQAALNVTGFRRYDTYRGAKRLPYEGSAFDIAKQNQLAAAVRGERSKVNEIAKKFPGLPTYEDLSEEVIGDFRDKQIKKNATGMTRILSRDFIDNGGANIPMIESAYEGHFKNVFGEDAPIMYIDSGSAKRNITDKLKQYESETDQQKKARIGWEIGELGRLYGSYIPDDPEFTFEGIEQKRLEILNQGVNE